MLDLTKKTDDTDTKFEKFVKGSKEFLRALAGNFLFQLVLFGTIFLLFTNLHFDNAVYVFGGLLFAFLLFVYWPRKR